MRYRGLVAIALAVGTCGAQAATYVVAPDGTGDFPTIQAAIDGIADGDIIELTDGTFTGDGNRDILVEEGVFTLRSQSADYERCVVDLQGSEADPHFGFRIGGKGEPSVILEGITITNGGGTSYRALDISGTVSIRSCRLTGNSGGAISVQGAHLEVYDTLITGNYAGGGTGVWSSFSHPLFVRCTITGNRASVRGGGIYCSEFGGIRLVQSVVWGNCADVAGDEIFVVNDVVQAECSIINTDGLATDGSGSFDFDEHTISVDPLFCDPASCEAAPTSEGDYHVSQTSPCLPAFSSCGQPIGALGEGCAAVPIEETSWGHLKEWYRAR
jgi:predicted outer membrane repeat protein